MRPLTPSMRGRGGGVDTTERFRRRRLHVCRHEEFGPLDKLWTCAKEWVEQSHAWHELPLPQVDAEAAASKAGEFGSQLARVSKGPREEGRVERERRAVLQAAPPRDEVL